jgi:hypothetical protein
VILAVVAITVRSTSAQDQWNDISNSDEKNVLIITDSGVVNRGNEIDLNEFERAGSDDAALGELTEASSRNTKQIDKNSEAIEQNHAEIERNTKQIAEITEEMDQLDRKLDRTVALVAALDFERPLAGKTARFSLGSSVFEGKSAVGFGLTAVKGVFDTALGISTTGDETLGKASIGVSF